MEFIGRILCQNDGVNIGGKAKELDAEESGHTVSLEDDSCAGSDEDALFVFQDDLGIDHFVRKIVTSGWLHRKNDSGWIVASKNWESVWVQLVVCQTHRNPSDQPLLLLYRNRSSPSPTSVYHLEDSIILPVNTKDTSLPSSVGFEIRPTNVTQAVPCSARVFLADSKRARDAWVYAISRSLLNFEKVKLRSPSDQGSVESPSRGTVVLDRSSTSRQDALARPPKLESCERSRSVGSQTGSLQTVEEGFSQLEVNRDRSNPPSPSRTPKGILPPRPVGRKPTSPLRHSRLGLVPPPPPPPNPPPSRRHR